MIKGIGVWDWQGFNSAEDLGARIRAWSQALHVRARMPWDPSCNLGSTEWATSPLVPRLHPCIRCFARMGTLLGPSLVTDWEGFAVETLQCARTHGADPAVLGEGDALPHHGCVVMRRS